MWGRIAVAGVLAAGAIVGSATSAQASAPRVSGMTATLTTTTSSGSTFTEQVTFERRGELASPDAQPRTHSWHQGGLDLQTTFGKYVGSYDGTGGVAAFAGKIAGQPVTWTLTRFATD